MRRIYRSLPAMLLSGALALFSAQRSDAAKSLPVHLLKSESFHHYFTEFAAQEQQLLSDHPNDAWPWFAENIPWIDLPDHALEQIYYFRWYSFEKHIRNTPQGYVISEFLDDVPWAGRYNSIGVAAEHHLREARWLRDSKYADQYASFWLSSSAEPRRYSLALAHASYSVYLATGDTSELTGLLPGLVANYQAWQKTHQDANGLFWQIDDRDGMEDSIGGSGYRPTINSYMYGDAQAISEIASLAGDTTLAQSFAETAAALRNSIEQQLWNPTDQFYETVPRGAGRAYSGVRELIGFVPWYFDLPAVAGHSVAWEQIKDAQGFAGEYGPTTAERRSPRYRFSDPHECLWNGPSWPFATTQTLVAMANLLNSSSSGSIKASDYRGLLTAYVRSQHLRLPGGKIIPWIDEDLDPDTGEWIARDILEARRQPPPNRGRYYNHSGFADLIITGLLGVRPAVGNSLRIHPLLSANQWSYFALDGLSYHGHLLTLFYDKTGNRYKRGAGMHVLCDGIQIGSAPKLKELTVSLPKE